MTEDIARRAVLAWPIILGRAWAILFETLAHPFTTSVVQTCRDGRIRVRRLRSS